MVFIGLYLYYFLKDYLEFSVQPTYGLYSCIVGCTHVMFCGKVLLEGQLLLEHFIWFSIRTIPQTGIVGVRVTPTRSTYALEELS